MDGIKGSMCYLSQRRTSGFTITGLDRVTVPQCYQVTLEIRYIYKDPNHLIKVFAPITTTRKNVKSRYRYCDATDNTDSQNTWIDSIISTIGGMGWFVTK